MYLVDTVIQNNLNCFELILHFGTGCPSTHIGVMVRCPHTFGQTILPSLQMTELFVPYYAPLCSFVFCRTSFGISHGSISTQYIARTGWAAIYQLQKIPVAIQKKTWGEQKCVSFDRAKIKNNSSSCLFRHAHIHGNSHSEVQVSA